MNNQKMRSVFAIIALFFLISVAFAVIEIPPFDFGEDSTVAPVVTTSVVTTPVVTSSTTIITQTKAPIVEEIKYNEELILSKSFQNEFAKLKARGFIEKMLDSGSEDMIMLSFLKTIPNLGKIEFIYSFERESSKSNFEDDYKYFYYHPEVKELMFSECYKQWKNNKYLIAEFDTPNSFRNQIICAPSDGSRNARLYQDLLEVALKSDEKLKALVEQRIIAKCQGIVDGSITKPSSSPTTLSSYTGDGVYDLKEVEIDPSKGTLNIEFTPSIDATYYSAEIWALTDAEKTAFSSWDVAKKNQFRHYQFILAQGLMDKNKKKLISVNLDSLIDQSKTKWYPMRNEARCNQKYLWLHEKTGANCKPVNIDATWNKFSFKKFFDYAKDENEKFYLVIENSAEPSDSSKWKDSVPIPLNIAEPKPVTVTPPVVTTGCKDIAECKAMLDLKFIKDVFSKKKT